VCVILNELQGYVYSNVEQEIINKIMKKINVLKYSDDMVLNKYMWSSERDLKTQSLLKSIVCNKIVEKNPPEEQWTLNAW
jgi:hypothetical protein